jgi:hypothetical protein
MTARLTLTLTRERLGNGEPHAGLLQWFVSPYVLSVRATSPHLVHTRRPRSQPALTNRTARGSSWVAVSLQIQAV